jgi:1,4-dihydroxy-2-naphthoate octaprenyltransferase
LKLIVFILLCIVSSNTYACFSSPEGLLEQHEFEAKSFFTLAIILFVIAIILRLICNHRRVWVPLLFVTTFTYWPAYIWHWGHAYSGSCGIPEIVLAFKILAGGMAVLSAYEVFNFYKLRRVNAT